MGSGNAALMSEIAFRDCSSQVINDQFNVEVKVEHFFLLMFGPVKIKLDRKRNDLFSSFTYFDRLLAFYEKKLKSLNPLKFVISSF
jgi:hypothetical protein